MTGDGQEGSRTEGSSSGEDPVALAHVVAVLQQLHRDGGAPPAMDAWLDALERRLAPFRMSPPPALEPLVFQAALPLLARRPSHAALPLWHARALRHLGAPVSADSALQAAHFAFEYSLRSGNFRVAHDVVDMARPHLVEATPSARIAWLEAEALEAWLTGDHVRAYAAVEHALALGAGYGAWEQGASAALSRGDLPRADVCLAAMASCLNPARTQDLAHARFLAAARARLGGDDKAAQAHMDACLALDATAIPAYFTTLWQLGRVYLDIAAQKHRRAARGIATVLTLASSLYWGFLEFSALLARAWLRLRIGRPADAATDLGRALELAELHGYRTCDPWRDPEALRELAELGRVQPMPRRDALRALTRRTPA